MVDIYNWARNHRPTARLYLDDSYIRVASATIEDFVCERRDRCYIILSKTVLHPKGGGQPSDTGRVYSEELEFRVTRAIEVNDVIVHYGKLVYGELSVGLKVNVSVDWTQRYNIMKAHTAGHIIDYAVLMAQGSLVNTYEANHGPPIAYIVYEAPPPSSEVLKQIELYANAVVKEARNVRSYWVPHEELQKYIYNAPNLHRLPKRDVYRVVEIQEVNAIPCTGTHVRNTKEINEIKITGAEPHPSGYKLLYIIY